MSIDINLLKKGDSVYIRSKGLISNAIAYISSGGRTSPDIPSHESRIYSIESDIDGFGTKRVKLIEVVFSGKRYYWLDDYEKKDCKIWVKRDDILNKDNTNKLLCYLQALDVKGYDWILIGSFLARFLLRKIFPKEWNFNWITRVLESKIAFVCSEYQNAGRRYIGSKVNEQETPYDNFRKIFAEEITTS